MNMWRPLPFILQCFDISSWVNHMNPPVLFLIWNENRPCLSVGDKVAVVFSVGRLYHCWFTCCVIVPRGARSNCVTAYEPQWGPVGRIRVCCCVHMCLLGGLQFVLWWHQVCWPCSRHEPDVYKWIWIEKGESLRQNCFSMLRFPFFKSWIVSTFKENRISC